MKRPRVLLVSKAVAPPFHDGAICLVRDLCAGLNRCDATVMSTAEAPAVPGAARHARIYARRSGFSPALRDNVRVLAHLAADRSHELWHFVFAPNPLSSRAGALLRRLRSVPIVQTVASRPLSFDRVQRLLFGDRVVTLSRHTADAFAAAGVPEQNLRVIPPPIADLARDANAREAARRAAGVTRLGPLFVYPGDLEFSSGAGTVAAAIPAVLRDLPDATFVFACRAKTVRAQDVQRGLAQELRSFGDRVCFAGEVQDLPALLASAAVVVFPVNDLYGKVDLPYAVLEACLLGVPVIVTTQGPLAELRGAPQVAPGDAEALAQQCVHLGRDAAWRDAIGQALRGAVLGACSPRAVASAYEDLYAELVAATT